MNCRTTITRTLRATPRRSISTSAPVLARGNDARDDTRRSDPWDIKNVQPFQFDDTTTLGHMILEKQREKLGSLMRIEQDRELLRGEPRPRRIGVEQRPRRADQVDLLRYPERAKAFPFQAPNPSTHYLRVTSFLNTSDPTDPLSSKKLLRVPVSRLPLAGPENVNRFKLLAGTRWIPPKGTRADGTLAEEAKKQLSEDDVEGWFEMSEEGWKEGRMNRKWLSDVLDGLVRESNVSAAPPRTRSSHEIDTEKIIVSTRLNSTRLCRTPHRPSRLIPRSTCVTTSPASKRNDVPGRPRGRTISRGSEGWRLGGPQVV